MARMRVEGDDLVVRPALWEKAAARHGNVRVPLTAVCRVTVETDWWRTVRGSQRRGTCVPGLVCIGTRAHQGGEDFIAVRPGRPLVCVELRPSAPLRLLVVAARTESQAEALARAVRRAAPRIDESTPWRQPLPVPPETGDPGG
ncbi:hypothetical protein [Streptomyces sp. NRRL S-813]|uniref:hypothetical protein n=1 Tax=Streptomyces sp. NRRL S-813 TaxID=1463919 RepID=UPI00068DE37A|nr:hypothetical protein [Streptomyces sp. NRRL S-813]